MRAPLALLLVATFCGPVAAMFPSAPLPPSQARPVAPLILDPGHGGKDLGAVAHGIQEKDVALAVALKVRDRLKSELPVMLTRSDDHYVTLDHRVDDAIDWDGALFVSIHLNKVRDRRLSGAVVYSFGVQPRSRRHYHRRLPRVPMLPAPPRVESRDSGDLAEALVAGMRRDGFRAKQAKDDFYVLKDPSQPSVLIELGYLSNPAEAKRLADPAYQDKLAATLAKTLEVFAAAHAVRAEDPAVDATQVAAVPSRNF